MSITDADYMPRDGSTNLTAAETGDGVKVGPCPLGGMLIEVYRPAAGTTFTVHFEESDDDDTYTDMAQPAAAGTTFTTAGIDHLKAFWEKQYVRHVVSACTGNFGAVEIGFVQGGKPS